MTLFSEKMFISTRCMCAFMSNWIIKSWKDSCYPSHSSGCHSSERNDTPEAQGDRSVTSHLDTWAESATPIIDRWRPFTSYLFSENDIFWYRLFISRKYRKMAVRYILPKIKYLRKVHMYITRRLFKNHLLVMLNRIGNLFQSL